MVHISGQLQKGRHNPAVRPGNIFSKQKITNRKVSFWPHKHHFGRCFVLLLKDIPSDDPLEGGSGVGIADSRWRLKFMARSQEALVHTIPKLPLFFAGTQCIAVCCSIVSGNKKQFHT